MKLPRTFYLRSALFTFELFTIVFAFSYILIDEAEFNELGREVCKKYESITGYCIDTEVIKIKKIEPFVIGLFIFFMSFLAGTSFNEMYKQYKKAKYGFKSTW